MSTLRDVPRDTPGTPLGRPRDISSKLRAFDAVGNRLCDLISGTSAASNIAPI